MPVNRRNRKAWHRGDMVIHDRDAKEQRLLRVVVAELPGGVLRTVYANRQQLPATWSERNKVFHDRPEHLLDPRRFGISTAKERSAA